jgi:hypothetical protein
MDFEQKFEFFKTCKNSHTRLLFITDLEYGGHDQEIHSLDQFYCKLATFGKPVGKPLWNLSENLNFFKTHKNSYTGSLCISNLECGGHDQEIQNFSQFLPQSCDLQ